MISVNTPISLISQGLNSIYIKRDDLIPFSFGGNKARKAFYFFNEIDAGGFDSVVTYGSSSSNHCRVVANLSIARGLPCTIISPKEVSNPTFNSQMMRLFGANIVCVPVMDVHETIEDVLLKLRLLGKKPYFIEGGGHGDLGTQAYVDCYEEIVQYEVAKQIHFDYIFFASGTGTTQAGLVCGQLLKGDNRAIVGISIARDKDRGRQVVLNSIKSYLSKMNVLVSEDDIERSTIFIDNYIIDGYGKSSQVVVNTINEMLLRTGIPMDGTYTGKAYCGMLDYIRAKDIQKRNILFIHTGGVPLFFDALQANLI